MSEYTHTDTVRPGGREPDRPARVIRPSRRERVLLVAVYRALCMVQAELKRYLDGTPD